MFCKKCGKENGEESKFCVGCGQSLEQIQNTNKQAQSVENQQNNNLVNNQSDFKSKFYKIVNTIPQTKEEKRKDFFMGMLVGLVIFVPLIGIPVNIAGAIYLLIKKKYPMSFGMLATPAILIAMLIGLIIVMSILGAIFG